MIAPLSINSRAHTYSVEPYTNLSAALSAVAKPKALWLVDRKINELYQSELSAVTVPERTVLVTATEEQKSLEALPQLFHEALRRGLKRDGLLVVVGGGVVQDIGCFLASVLFRGLRWELVPTTLLAQADSCIGSKSSINIGDFKNQIGTFYPPNRILLTTEVLKTLPRDEIRSGLGEVIKLQLLSTKSDFDELMLDLVAMTALTQPETLNKWIYRSLVVKKTYIEADEFDRGVRNILNYGHTFGHAYESATHYAIPHGISVILGILTATFLSSRIGLVDPTHYSDLKNKLRPWHDPYAAVLRKAERAQVFRAIKHDKKTTGDAVNCILTRGPGKMEKVQVDFDKILQPAVNCFIDEELNQF